MFGALLTRITQQLEGGRRPRDLEDNRGMLVKQFTHGEGNDFNGVWRPRRC
jgi:hypothetical protein